MNDTYVQEFQTKFGPTRVVQHCNQLEKSHLRLSFCVTHSPTTDTMSCTDDKRLRLKIQELKVFGVETFTA